jgi:hypothetical protein
MHQTKVPHLDFGPGVALLLLSGLVGRLGGMDTAPAELPPPTLDADGRPVCCGTGGAWTPKKGEPLIPSCEVCPRSASLWRRPKG